MWMASVVSASSATIGSAAPSIARFTTSISRQRLVALRGRDSSIRTGSPPPPPFAPSCGRAPVPPWSCAWSWSSSLRSSPGPRPGRLAAGTGLGELALGHDRQDAGDLPPRLRDLVVVGELPCGQLETKVVEVALGGRELRHELGVGGGAK